MRHARAYIQVSSEEFVYVFFKVIVFKQFTVQYAVKINVPKEGA